MRAWKNIYNSKILENILRFDLTKNVFATYKKKIWGRNQDGGVGGHGIHLSTQMHQEYIYKWDNPHRAPAED